MPKIQLLSKALAELIAAGEVVERPASIAKELIENAVDAGATAITVEIEGGGAGFLRISDNGCGIAREEIPTAFLRHATSKISSQDDLEAILTLGFRGEALASIAAMAKVELRSKTTEEDEGTLYRIEGGQQIEISPTGCPQGTIITVRDVFYNTPARMKFLKKDVGEGNALSGVVDKCALCYPGVAFKFIRDGKVRLQTSGGGELLPVIAAVYGKDFAGGLLPCEHHIPQEGVRVKGYITAPNSVKPSRAYQNFFLNNRYVRTRTGPAALEEAFKTYAGLGKFPGCVLNIEIEPTLVDVNVHPAKIEVRFVNERPIFHCIYFAAKNAINPTTQSVQTTLSREESQPIVAVPPKTATPQGRMTAEQFRALYTPRERNDWVGESALNKPLSLRASTPETLVQPRPESLGGPPKDFLPPPVFDEILPPECDTIEQTASIEGKSATIITKGQVSRLIGELAGVYILLEREGDLVIIDKHAAHERILYERLKSQLAYGNRQLLLAPLTLTFTSEEHAALTQNQDTLLALGFLLEDFGGNTLLVRETPLEISGEDTAFLLGDIAAKLQRGNLDLTTAAMDKLLLSIACRGALRARDKNSLPELEAIIDMLDENPAITHCPHGRPVEVSMSAQQIAKLFGRQG